MTLEECVQEVEDLSSNFRSISRKDLYTRWEDLLFGIPSKEQAKFLRFIDKAYRATSKEFQTALVRAMHVFL